MIIDTGRRTTDCLDCLKSAGVTAVIRYYARETRMPEKRLTRGEAEALVSAGIRIGVVFQSAGDGPACFSGEIGSADGAYARDYAASVIGQPTGSAIYFAVDYDAGESDVRERIVPYFRAVVVAMAMASNGWRYRVGVYGGGLVCRAVCDVGLAEFAWLANQPGATPFDRWTLCQAEASTLCGIAVDRNLLHPDAESFGAFAALEPPPVVD